MALTFPNPIKGENRSSPGHKTSYMKEDNFSTQTQPIRQCGLELTNYPSMDHDNEPFHETTTNRFTNTSCGSRLIDHVLLTGEETFL
jgi:hypothetical protein